MLHKKDPTGFLKGDSKTYYNSRSTGKDIRKFILFRYTYSYSLPFRYYSKICIIYIIFMIIISNIVQQLKCNSKNNLAPHALIKLYLVKAKTVNLRVIMYIFCGQLRLALLYFYNLNYFSLALCLKKKSHWPFLRNT